MFFSLFLIPFKKLSFNKHSFTELLAGSFVDFISILNQHCQRNKINSPKYSEGPGVSGGFGANCTVRTDVFHTQKYCSTKKEARQNAAMVALLGLNISVGKWKEAITSLHVYFDFLSVAAWEITNFISIFIEHNNAVIKLCDRVNNRMVSSCLLLVLLKSLTTVSELYTFLNVQISIQEKTSCQVLQKLV